MLYVEPCNKRIACAEIHYVYTVLHDVYNVVEKMPV